MFRPSLGQFESSWRFWEPKCWNAEFWPLTWLWPDTWPFKKKFKSALEPSRWDLSNAASPVSLRSLVWELAWGGVIRPPPPGQWRSAETPVKRGLKLRPTINFRIWHRVELLWLQNRYLWFSKFSKLSIFSFQYFPPQSKKNPDYMSNDDVWWTCVQIFISVQLKFVCHFLACFVENISNKLICGLSP